jgi:radical SAM superfamily enzyme YgiQ (UPF0313 family)
MSSLILVSLDWLRKKDNKRTLGHSSLLARCIEKGFKVESVNSAVNDKTFSVENVFDTILTHLTFDTTIGFGVYIWNDQIVQQLIGLLRQNGHTNTIILGGPQISYAGKGVSKFYPQADVFIRGYGEESLVSYLANPNQKLIPGVTFQNGHDRSSISESNLEELPSPILMRIVPLNPFMRWETQRGCIYRCSFCQHREAGRLKQNTLSNERISAEIEILSQGLVNDIAVLDPIFNNSDRETEILHLFYQHGYKGHLSLQCRFESLTTDFMDICSKLNVTLEFGLQTIHPLEMKAIIRRNNMPLISEKIKELHHRNIHFEVSLIYGLPNQTVDSFKQSIQWCFDHGVPSLKAFPLMLLRGTKLHQDRSKWNLKESEPPIPVVISSNSFSYADWLEMEKMANTLQHNISLVAK